MQILPTDSSELGNFPYLKIQEGVYSHQPSGRVLFIESDESAILVIRDTSISDAVVKP